MRLHGKIESIKTFREAYFSAKTPLKRVGHTIATFFSYGMMLVFSVVWLGISGGFLFSVLRNETPLAEKWFPLVFVGLFVAVGIGLFAFGAYRLGSLIRIIVKYPPTKNFPEIFESAGTPPEENADGDNPFRRGAAESEATKAVSAKSNSLAERIVPVVLGIVFFVAGISVSTIGVKNFLEEEKAAGTWISAPCKIVSAKMESRSGSGRRSGTTYSPEIVYEFSVGGKTYRGDDIFMSMNASSSDYDKEKHRLQKYKKVKNCWFNPENPEENALIRPTGGVSLRKIILPLFGVPFVLIGGAILASALFGKFFKKKYEAKKAAVPLDALEAKDSPKAAAFGSLIFAFLWNFLVFVFGACFFSDGAPGTFVVVILSAFAAIGAGALLLAIRNLLKLFCPSYEVLIFPTGTLVPGNFARAEWRVKSGNPANLESLKIEFVRLEKTGWEIHGNPQEKAVERISVFETMSRAEIASGSCEFRVPENISSGKRALRLSGKTSALLPNFKCDFRLP